MCLSWQLHQAEPSFCRIQDCYKNYNTRQNRSAKPSEPHVDFSTNWNLGRKVQCCACFIAIVMWGQSWEMGCQVRGNARLCSTHAYTKITSRKSTLRHIHTHACSSRTPSTLHCRLHCPTKMSNSSPLSHCKLRWGLHYIGYLGGWKPLLQRIQWGSPLRTLVSYVQQTQNVIEEHDSGLLYKTNKLQETHFGFLRNNDF